MDWRQWFYIIYSGGLVVILYGYWYFLYHSERGREMEKGKFILFSDDPLEPDDD